MTPDPGTWADVIVIVVALAFTVLLAPTLRRMGRDDHATVARRTEALDALGRIHGRREQ